MSASAYYQRASGPPSQRTVSDADLTERIREVHRENYAAYGYRRMWPALTRQGEDVGRDQVARLMRQAGIQGAERRGKPWKTIKPIQLRLAAQLLDEPAEAGQALDEPAPTRRCR